MKEKYHEHLLYYIDVNEHRHVIFERIINRNLSARCFIYMATSLEWAGVRPPCRGVWRHLCLGQEQSLCSSIDKWSLGMKCSRYQACVEEDIDGISQSTAPLSGLGHTAGRPRTWQYNMSEVGAGRTACMMEAWGNIDGNVRLIVTIKTWYGDLSSVWM